jgi:hypothetical protein
METLPVGEVARLAGCPPQFISQAFYRRRLDADRCPIIAGRRHIPRSYVAEIIRVVRRMRDRGVNAS